MHKSGHIGFSLFLSSIPVFLLLRLEFAVFASIFIGSVAMFSMLPDIDMKLRHISDSIEHRGVTHSLQFSLFIGVLYSVLALILTLLLYLMGNTQIFTQIHSLTTLHPLLGYLFVFVSGVCGVLFHILGDMFTPTGVSLTNPYQTTGYSFDLFVAKDTVANQSAIPIGIAALILSFFCSQNPPLLDSIVIFTAGISLLFTVWLFLIKTTLGRVIYKLADYIYSKL